MVKKNELGACHAIIDGISTKVDGSCQIKLSVNPEDQEIINKLLKCFLSDQKLLMVAFVRVDESY
jgi:flagellar biosynthesis/type III secretory pathway protein FliH